MIIRKENVASGKHVSKQTEKAGLKAEPVDLLTLTPPCKFFSDQNFNRWKQSSSEIVASDGVKPLFEVIIICAYASR